MALSTTVKSWVNQGLAPLGVKLDTLTRDRAEHARILALQAEGYFARPVFPLLPAMEKSDPALIFEALVTHRDRFDDFASPDANDVGFCLDNDYFSSPDAEVLYCMIRTRRPKRVVEIGCGHSTKVSRLAIEDGSLGTTLCCIDPEPRQDIGDLADELISTPVEKLRGTEILDSLAADDILFIDSSHEVRIANDTVYLYLEVLPRLASGVLIHIHDVFLPYDYPADWVIERGMLFNEQYVVQALLQDCDSYDVLWAGHYLQRTHARFSDYFARLGPRNAQSLWLAKR